MGTPRATATSPYIARRPPLLPVAALGTTFPNPLGVAAGIDREGIFLDWPDFDAYGFVEIGTIRGGDEADALMARLSVGRCGGRRVGVNIGSRSDGFGVAAIQDYAAAMTTVWAAADYIVVNLTSPGAPQRAAGGDGMAGFLSSLRSEAQALGQRLDRRVPLLVKMAGTDRAGLLTARTEGFDGAVVVGGPQDGVDIASVSMDLAPLQIISVGGIRTSADMAERLAAGAKLVQVFTAALSGGGDFAASSLADLAAWAKGRDQ